MSMFRFTFLGTGTSQGVPMIACDCAVCGSKDTRNQRMRCSACLETDLGLLLIDTPPDLRSQALRANLKRVDAVLLTHAHSDHIMGFDDLRRFSHIQNQILPVYGSAETLGRMKEIFSYVFDGLPKLPHYLRATLHPLDCDSAIELAGCRITPVKLPHGNVTVFGYLFEQDTILKLAYLPDCREVPPPLLEKLRGVQVLVLDALRPKPHPNHLCLDDALAVVRRVRPERAFFIHMTHDLEHVATCAELPDSVALAYDGLVLEL